MRYVSHFYKLYRTLTQKALGGFTSTPPHTCTNATQQRIALYVLLITPLWVYIPHEGAGFFSVLFMWLLFALDIRILGFAAIGLLVAIPTLQYGGMDEQAEQMAVYVYYVLVMLVTIQIADQWKENRNTKHSQEK
jgi:hypothetical protein